MLFGAVSLIGTCWKFTSGWFPCYHPAPQGLPQDEPKGSQSLISLKTETEDVCRRQLAGRSIVVMARLGSAMVHHLSSAWVWTVHSSGLQLRSCRNLKWDSVLKMRFSVTTQGHICYCDYLGLLSSIDMQTQITILISWGVLKRYR